MRNNRSLLLGLGSGLVLGASLLQLMTAAAPSQGAAREQSEQAQLSIADKEALKSAASQYYKVLDLDERVYSQAEADALAAQKVKEELERLEKSQPAEAEDKANEASSAQEIYIYVEKGQGVRETGLMLLKSGLIQDVELFEAEMRKQKLSTKIVAGTHRIASARTLQEIILQLTTP